MNLHELKSGQTGIIKMLERSNPVFHSKLLRMGLTPGTQVKLVRRAPLGGPIQVHVRGYSLSLRSTEAKQVALQAF